MSSFALLSGSNASDVAYGRHVAGEMESQLRPQQPRRIERARREDEVEIRPSPRLEFELVPSTDSSRL